MMRKIHMLSISRLVLVLFTVGLLFTGLDVELSTGLQLKSPTPLAGAQELGGGLEPVPDDDWELDIDVALAASKQDGKYLLLDFTGSDWCPPCIRLEKEVLSQESFLVETSKQFHRVKLDFPQNQLLVPAKLMEKNQEWMKRLGVDGFPTIVLIDSEGRPFGFLGYQAGGPQPYLAELQKRLAAKARFDQLLEQANAAEGAERATLLDQSLEALDLEIGKNHYKEIVETILALDSEHQVGLREKYRGDLDAEQRKAILADLLLMVRLRSPEDVLGMMDALLAEIPMTPQMEATILQIRLDLERKSGDIPAALQSLDRLAFLYAEDPDAWQRVMARRFFILLADGQETVAVSSLDQSLTERPRSPRLLMARGDWQQKNGEIEEALFSYDQGLAQSGDSPDLRWELTAAKADLMFTAGKADPAITVLEEYAANEAFPADLRAKALVHKAIFLRQQDKGRAALLSENKALGLIDSPKRRAELERLIQEVRTSFP
jgi:thioredoxin-related protein